MPCKHVQWQRQSERHQRSDMKSIHHVHCYFETWYHLLRWMYGWTFFLPFLWNPCQLLGLGLLGCLFGKGWKHSGVPFGPQGIGVTWKSLHHIYRSTYLPISIDLSISLSIDLYINLLYIYNNIYIYIIYRSIYRSNLSMDVYIYIYRLLPIE